MIMGFGFSRYVGFQSKVGCLKGVEFREGFCFRDLKMFHRSFLLNLGKKTPKP